MNIKDKAYVAIDYRLTLDSGEEVDRSEPGQPLGFVFGCGQIIPGLEKQLRDRETGYEATLVVPPEEGYGAHSPELVREITKSSFPDDVKLEAGMVFQTDGPHGPIVIRVAEVKDEVVVADLNHPLAGQTLHFEIKVAEVREATEDELQALEHTCQHDSCEGCGAH